LTRHRIIFLYPAFLLCAWTAAWFLDVFLRDTFRWGTAPWGTTADALYWIAMNVAIWIVPLLALLRREQRNAADYLMLREPTRGIGIGVLIGAGVILFSLLLDVFLGGASVVIPVLDMALINAILVAPVVEEIALRGFYMRAVADSGASPGNANWYTALLFVTLHLPGWYFQARLRSPLSLFQPALFLLLLALFLGWIKDRTQSLWVAMVVHVMNNAYAAFRG
jgi:membrane protease YdiL (CAAX protease family)